MENHPSLRLHIPEPEHRPGDAADFSRLRLPRAGSVDRPAIATPAFDMRELAYALIRVLDDDGKAVGPWDPKTGRWHATQRAPRHAADARL